jgi:hypothetical protein
VPPTASALQKRIQLVSLAENNLVDLVWADAQPAPPHGAL